LVDFDNGDGSITFIIVGAIKSRRKGDKAFALQGEQHLSTCHVLEPTVWLKPVPFLAKNFGDLLTSLIPMPVNGSLNQIKIGLVNGSFSDGNGKHPHCIAERKRGRQQIIQKSKKTSGEENLARKLVKNWVEMKNRGLIFSGNLAYWTY